jgi:peptidoglycan/LPS O-acetylase OafA/YrhL
VHPKRYVTLDAWRGAAALGVLMYHRFLNRLPLVGGLWMAVQIFFVISGYCIAVAADGAIRRDLGFGAFMRRRLHRIAPPYLASCVFAVVLRLLWKGLAPIAAEWGMYLQNFFMLQWVSLTHAQLAGLPAPSSAAANPRLLVSVYWSLNYEEQFYLIAAALVALAFVWRARASAILLATITAGVAVFNIVRPGMVTGLFCDYWLQFACGVALYIRLCKVPNPRAARWFDLALASAFGACVIEALRQNELSLDPHTFHYWGQLTICLGFAGLLVVVRPFDERLARTAVGRVFGGFGKFSYSLYLVHIPILGALNGLEKRLHPRIGGPATDVCVVAMVIFFSWVFYRLFERPFLNRPLADAPAEPARVQASQGEPSFATEVS